MTLTRGFTDEIKMLSDISDLGASAGELLNITLGRVGSFAKSPMTLSASFPTADAKINIGSSLIEAGDHAGKSVPAIDDLIPSTTSATTIDFQTGSVTGQTVLVDGSAFALPTGTVGRYRRYALVLRSNGNIDSTFSAEAVSVSALTNAGTLLKNILTSVSGMPVGWIDLECDNVSGKYRTAGSLTAVIENKVGSNLRIFRFGAGSGGGISQGTLDSETTARMNADSTITANLTSEISSRLAGDSSLQANINSEVTSRLSGDSSLQANLNSEVTSRLNSDSTLTANLNSEISSRLAEDSSLQANINSEITSRLNADSTLQAQINVIDPSAVSNEATARMNADSSLQSNLNSEITSRLNSDSTLTANLNSEVTSRENSDSTLTANLNSEISSRLAGDSSLQANIDSEQTSRLNSDSTLTANLNSEISSRLAGDSSLQSNIDSEQTSRLNSDSTLTANLNIETTARLNADSTLLTAIYANTTDILESLKNQFTDSIYSLLTPVVFKTDNTTFTATATNGAYSLSDKAFLYSAIGGIFESTNLLDTNEFLAATPADMQDVSQIDLQIHWKYGKTDTAAVYSVSRDGGSNYQTIPMTLSGYGSTGYYGSYKFTDEISYASLATQASGSSNKILDDASVQSIGQLFTLADAAVIKTIDLDITVTGTPLGSLYVSLVKSSAGLPSTSSSDIYSESLAISASGLSTGSYTVSMPSTPLPAGSYYFVVRTDSIYKEHYTATTDSIGLTYDASADGCAKYNGTSWSDSSADGLKYTVKGRKLDLRVKIVSSATDKAIDGFGVFYAPSSGNIISTQKKIQVFRFKSATDNLNTFAVTSFILDKDLVKVYWAESGLCLVYPGFQISGNSIVFPTNTFYDASDVDVTLVVQMLEGSSFDNSDMNGALLTENHLGSISATLDRSVTGRGILLRNANGVLREIALDADDNIVVLDT